MYCRVNGELQNISQQEYASFQHATQNQYIYVETQRGDAAYGMHEPPLIRFENDRLDGMSSDVPLIADRSLLKQEKQYFEIDVTAISNAASIGLCYPSDGYISSTASKAPLTGVYIWLNGYTNQYRLLVSSSGNITVLNDINNASPIATYGLVIDFDINSVQLYRNGSLVCENDCANVAYDLKDFDLYPYIKFGASPISGMFNFGESAFKYKMPNGCVSVYDTMRGSAFTKLTDKWPELSDVEKLTLFNSISYQKPTIANMEELGRFKVLILSYLPEQQTLQLKAAPKAKFVLPRQLTSIDSFEKVQQVKAAANVSVNASCRILVTTNLKDYYTYDALEMQWGQVDITGEITGDVWINAADITSIPTAAWDSLLKGKAGVGFAYLLEIEETTDHCDVDRLELIVNAKGTWEKV